ncbi:MAG: hypothetical protein CMH30_04075 [Micavibrio sp.]|nr:hypothetical protein [Micavibrio sp.]|tara:strand:+ start:663 stop:1040 length:378 start_codon:yes stop_codon:yes gene_type:complete
MKQLKEIRKMNNIIALGDPRTITEASSQLNDKESDLQYFDVKFWVDECHTQREQVEDIISQIRQTKESQPIRKRISVLALRQELALSWKRYKQCHKRTTKLYNQYMTQIDKPHRYNQDISVSIAA